jgi:hypothetical protein
MVAKTPARKRDDVTSRKRDDDSTPPKGPGSPVQLRGHPRGPARFTKREIVRFSSAAERAGAERVQLNLDGSLQAIFAKQAPAAALGSSEPGALP